jgi:hypothetical protein
LLRPDGTAASSMTGLGRVLQCIDWRLLAEGV